MWCNVVAAGANVVLDWLMIVVLGWGLFGAAIASFAVLYLFAFYLPAIQKMASR